ncbi:MAG: phosphoenolpyruvate synthase, partial [Methanoregulaceae archaeon]|nr:phosphoenolpyruvate synthase [Methanoregulaceae archaeon]
MKEMPDILWLEEIRKEDIASVGGKGASLGEMSSIGLPVPGGFVVTSHAFRRFLIEAGIEQPLFSDLERLDVDDNAALEQASQKAKSAVLKAKMPASLREEIKKAYKRLDSGSMV